MAAVVPTGRAVVVGSLVAVIALGWAYLFVMVAHGMGAMDAMAPMPWSASTAAAMLLMWVLMMVAMMLPSALPMILILDRFNTSRGQGGVATALFACGYVLVWAGFSVLATAAQWALEQSGLLSGQMAFTSGAIAAFVFIAAGAWQFAPLKRTCLDACRSPIGFLSAHWREGRAGALLMGLHHGAFCVGCCWVLMALLFVGGVMSLLWIVPIALFVLIEKCLPGGERLGKLGGVLLVVWGAAALFTAVT